MSWTMYGSFCADHPDTKRHDYDLVERIGDEQVTGQCDLTEDDKVENERRWVKLPGWGYVFGRQPGEECIQIDLGRLERHDSCKPHLTEQALLCFLRDHTYSPDGKNPGCFTWWEGSGRYAGGVDWQKVYYGGHTAESREAIRLMITMVRHRAGEGALNDEEWEFMLASATGKIEAFAVSANAIDRAAAEFAANSCAVDGLPQEIVPNKEIDEMSVLPKRRRRKPDDYVKVLAEPPGGGTYVLRRDGKVDYVSRGEKVEIVGTKLEKVSRVACFAARPYVRLAKLPFSGRTWEVVYHGLAYAGSAATIWWFAGNESMRDFVTSIVG